MKKLKEYKKYHFKCPQCESEFDCSGQLEVWKDEFIEKLNKLVEDKK